MNTSKTVHCSRRGFVQTVSAATLFPWASAQAQEVGGVLKIGQSTALTGPLGDLGQALLHGAKACFDGVNAKGGVNGRKIELVTQDDGYDAKRALANAEAFIADKDIFGLFSCLGTPMVEAMLPKVLEAGIPFFAPYTGALLARPKARNVFNIRASYPDEAEQLVMHLATLGVKRIGVAYQNNAFGKEVLEGARQAMEKHKITLTAAVSIENTGADAAAAATQLLADPPEAMLLGLAGKPTIDFVKSMRQQRRGMQLYALSVLGAAATLKALGDDAVGMAVSQVVPLPTNSGVPLVREFQQAWKQLGSAMEPSHLALEGYINARVFVEAVRRAGNKLSRESFIEATWGLKKWDMGGFEINATEVGRSASRFVELTMVNKQGRFIR